MLNLLKYLIIVKQLYYEYDICFFLTEKYILYIYINTGENRMGVLIIISYNF